MELRLQFRFRPTRSFEDIDLSRLAPAVGSLPFIVRHKFYDDRLSDADFVTLVVAIRDPSPDQLEALRDVLVSVPSAQAFAVDRSGTAQPLAELLPDCLIEAAVTDASVDD